GFTPAQNPATQRGSQAHQPQAYSSQQRVRASPTEEVSVQRQSAYDRSFSPRSRFNTALPSMQVASSLPDEDDVVAAATATPAASSAVSHRDLTQPRLPVRERAAFDVTSSNSRAVYAANASSPSGPVTARPAAAATTGGSIAAGIPSPMP